MDSLQSVQAWDKKGTPIIENRKPETREHKQREEPERR
jgi:hypothetical protein